jgi:hypothetical protein
MFVRVQAMHYCYDSVGMFVCVFVTIMHLVYTYRDIMMISDTRLNYDKMQKNWGSLLECNWLNINLTTLNLTIRAFESIVATGSSLQMYV